MESKIKEFSGSLAWGLAVFGLWAAFAGMATLALMGVAHFLAWMIRLL